MATEHLFAARAAGMKASEIRELLKLLDQPDVISFAGGVPDPALFPHEGVRTAYAGLLGSPDIDNALQYQVSEGYLPLRRWIKGLMAKAGVTCGEDNIFITSGSQQGLDFLGKLYVSPGDGVLVTAPTYLGALQAFNAYEPTYEPLPIGQDKAVATAETVRASDHGGKAKLAYIVPDFSNPTGETLGLEDRKKLVELAAERDLVVVEDAAYRDLRYDGEPVPSILSLDCERSGGIDESRTVYCGSFSKILAPGLRVGWICAARSIVDRLVLMKQAGDLHSSSMNQMVIHRLAETSYDTQVERLCEAYGSRRDKLIAALENHMPDRISWTHPAGGMFVWVTLPESVDTKDLLAQSIAESRVAFVPGGAFHADGSGRNTLRLCFTQATDRALEDGIPRLAGLIRRRVN